MVDYGEKKEVNNSSPYITSISPIDLLKYLLYFKYEDFYSLINAKDKKHMIKFYEISYNILKSITKQNRLLLKNN